MVYVFEPEHLRRMVRKVVYEIHCDRKAGKSQCQPIAARLRKLLTCHYTNFIAATKECKGVSDTNIDTKTNTNTDSERRQEDSQVLYASSEEYLILIQGGPRRNIVDGARCHVHLWDIVLKGSLQVSLVDCHNNNNNNINNNNNSQNNNSQGSGARSVQQEQARYVVGPGEMHYRHPEVQSTVSMDDDVWILEYGRGVLPQLFGTTLSVHNPFPLHSLFGWLGVSANCYWHRFGQATLSCCFGQKP
jgi:hypothetical protein